VHDGDGRVVAAVSVSGPSFRLASGVLGDLAPVLVAATEALSRRLGFFRRGVVVQDATAVVGCNARPGG
jgi:hypothetical protein